MAEGTPTRIGDYEVLGVLGAGGMGKVYKVRNVITERTEAMKVLLPNLADRRELAERFLREIKILAGLCHPNIAQLRTALTWENQLVMVMEYVEGVTLASRLSQGPLPVSEAVDYIRQALSALGYAHHLHIIHRDIKPANMMLTPEGVVKLMDFGIARSQGDPLLTATGSTLGSLHYMSPEQLRAEPVDERSDLYSVGVTLYELVTGKRPFQADSDVAVMAALLQKTPAQPIEVRPDLPTTLNEIIVQAMQKDPGQRFQSAEAFRHALSVVETGVPAAKATAPSRAAGTEVGLETIRSATPSPEVLRAVASGSAPELPAALREPGPAAAKAEPGKSLPPAQPGSQSAAGSPNARGIYMVIGALVTIIVLAAAGLYLPRFKKAHANVETAAITQPAPTTKSTTEDANGAKPPLAEVKTPPATAATTTTPTTVAEKRETQPAAQRESPRPTSTDREAARSKTPPVMPRSEVKSQQNVAPAGEQRAALNPAAQPPAPSKPEPAVDVAQLQQLEHDMDLLSSRAEAVNASLDGLRQSQAAQGLGLRGDISASQQRMRTYLGKAETALKNQDASGVRKYLGLAETEVAVLEKFLGR